MKYQKFCINPDIGGHYGKLSELHFNVSSPSNHGDKVIALKFQSATLIVINRPCVAGDVLQLDGVGPVDKRPSTD